MPIGTTALAVLGGLGSAVIQGSASRSAAKSQERGAKNQLALQERMYDETTGNFAPFLQSGQNALSAYNFEMGMGDRPEGYAGIQETPAFLNQLEMGRDTIESGASARGKLFSGASGTALERYRTGLASQETNNYLNRLANMTTMGQASAGQQAAAGQNFATGGANAMANASNAQAAGAIGMGNAISSGIDTGMGLYGYLNQQQQQAGGMTTPIRRPF